ncbi:UDP-N-acetylmuramate dehydrogenase [Caulobacter sp. S45]|uniref:UDP-N-acetylmuramate dehydrogenase n=1 Tax=Caulobacter sp. S45 TaxID=1641861 RepID=UPI001576109B|nr:UDP-N-acetylmuramate dehydrogenase [Caulobacter sp. S45]
MTWRNSLPRVRGRILFDEPLATYTWLRVGGPADVLYLPADEHDLQAFLVALDPHVPVVPLGVGSNTLVRDEGVEGVVIRLAGRTFATVQPLDGARLSAGAGALDAQLAKAAARAGIAGLEFYTGVPGAIGGACVMNAGCYGAETKDVLVEAQALTRGGEKIVISNAQMGFSYRHAGAAADEPLIFTAAVFQGRPDDPAAITERMHSITARREAAQPIREKTGGSTFKNPPGRSAWQVVDELGWRGRPFGGAMFSPKHANFLINTGEASAADLEGLGEAVRADARARLAIELEWEVKRIGREAPASAQMAKI